MPEPWRVADIIDLEAQLALDRVAAHAQGGQASGLDQRDREIGAALQSQNDDELLRGWVIAMRERSDHLPGQRLMVVLAGLRALGLLAALATGVLLASAALRYDGSQPVSVLSALALLVFLPGLLLLLTLVLQLPLLRRCFALTGGPLQWLFSHAALPLLRRALPRSVPGYQAAFISNVMRQHQGQLVYGGMWRSFINESVQQLGMACMLAALLTVCLIVIFTDIAFGWGSTLQLDEAFMQQLVHWLSQPWAWLWPDAVPDAQLIHNSQYNRLDDSFAGAGADRRAFDAQALGQWWVFLVACMISWTLLPRLLTLFYFRHRRKQQLLLQSKRSADLLEHQEQLQRLRNRGSRFRSSPGSSVPEKPAADKHGDTWPAEPITSMVIWDHAIDESAARSVHTSLQEATQSLNAGHDVDARIDAAVISDISAQTAGAIAVFIDGDEQPLAEVLAFLRDLEAASGKRQRVVILLNADPDNHARWQQALKPLDYSLQDAAQP